MHEQAYDGYFEAAFIVRQSGMTSYCQRRAIVDRCVVLFVIGLGRAIKSSTFNGATNTSRNVIRTDETSIQLEAHRRMCCRKIGQSLKLKPR